MYNVIFEQMFKRSVDNLRLFVGAEPIAGESAMGLLLFSPK